MEQLGLESAFMWDTGVAGSGSFCCVKILAPLEYYSYRTLNFDMGFNFNYLNI